MHMFNDIDNDAHMILLSIRVCGIRVYAGMNHSCVQSRAPLPLLNGRLSTPRVALVVDFRAQTLDRELRKSRVKP